MKLFDSLRRFGRRKECEPVLRLRNGSVLSCEVADSSQISLHLCVNGAKRQSIVLPERRAGIAGVRLFLSQSERVVVVSCYSGQSEEGFDVVDLEGEPRLIGRQPYFIGEGTEVVFSNEDKFFVAASPSSSIDWWQPFDDEETEAIDENRVSFYFGTLVVCNLPETTIERSKLWLVASAKWLPRRQEYDSNLFPELTGDGLRLVMPWGPIGLPFPLPPVVQISVPEAA